MFFPLSYLYSNNPLIMASSPCYKAGLITLAILPVFLTISSSAYNLSTEFYSKSCPKLPDIVKSGVQHAINKEARMGASLLRLHFHDCFVNGCDASILLDDNSSFTGEKGANVNLNSARGFEVIDSIKSNVEKECNRTVSCADILALAARDSVGILGGPNWSVKLGRRDTRTASLADANDGIPSSNWTLDAIISRFNALGFSTNELVALTGAHTLRQTNNSTTLETPIKFNMNYFNNQDNQSDADKKKRCHGKMLNGKQTKSFVREYGNDPNTFWADFSKAMTKMSEIKPLTGLYGEIRKNCGRVNK